MQRIVSLLAAFLAMQFALPQSPCLPDGITFTSQAQIDNFQVNHPGCTEIEGDVILSGGNIFNLMGLNVLTAVYSDLHIGIDPVPTKLSNLSGLENLESVGGSLSIYLNDSLTNIEALGNLQFIGDDLIILRNYVLTSLTGLESIETVPGNLLIRGNSILENLAPLQGLYYIGGDLNVARNSALTDLTGLEGITQVPGDVTLFGSGLVNLTGLDNLDSIGDHLRIGDPDFFWNTSLTDLSALQNLEYIGGALLIYWNEILPNLSGLDNVDGNSIQIVEIIGNPELSECSVQSLCDYLASPNGTVFIGDNGSGCNSFDEVLEACETIGINLKEQPTIRLHPNPTDKGSITVTLENHRKKASLSCFDIFGQQLFQQEIVTTVTSINVSTWPPGIYIAVVYEDGKPESRTKIVVTR